MLYLFKLYVSTNKANALKVQLGSGRLNSLFNAQDQVSSLEDQNERYTTENKQLITHRKSDLETIEQLKIDLAKNDRVMMLHMDLIQYQLGDLKMKGSKLLVVETEQQRNDRIQARVNELCNSLNIKIEQAQIGITGVSTSSRGGLIAGSSLTLEQLNDVITKFVESNAGSGGIDNVLATPDQKCMFGPLTTHFKSNRSSTSRNEKELSFGQYSLGPNAMIMISRMRKKQSEGGRKITLDNLNIIAQHAIMRVNIKMKAARTLDYKTLFDENERTKKRKNHDSLVKTADLPGYHGAMLITPVDDGGRPIGLVVCFGGYYGPDEPKIWQQVFNRTWQAALGKSDITRNVEGGLKLIRRLVPEEIANVILSKIDANRSVIEQLNNINTLIYHDSATCLRMDISNCTSLAIEKETTFIKLKVVKPFIKRVRSLLKKKPFVNNLLYIKSDGDSALIGQVSGEIIDHAELCLLFALRFQETELPDLNEALKVSNVKFKIHCGLSSGKASTTFEYMDGHLTLDMNGSPVDMASKLESSIGTTSHIDELRGICDIAMSKSYINKLKEQDKLKSMKFSWEEYNIEDIKINSYGKCSILGHGKPSVEVFGITY